MTSYCIMAFLPILPLKPCCILIQVYHQQQHRVAVAQAAAAPPAPTELSVSSSLHAGRAHRAHRTPVCTDLQTPTSCPQPHTCSEPPRSPSCHLSILPPGTESCPASTDITITEHRAWEKESKRLCKIISNCRKKLGHNSVCGF